MIEPFVGVIGALPGTRHDNLQAELAATSQVRRDFDWGNIGNMIAQFFQRLMERFSDRGNSQDSLNTAVEDAPTIATAPDGQPLPVATLTRADLSNTSFTGLSPEEEKGANRILSLIGDGRATDAEKPQIASILDEHPRLATLQVESKIPMFNRPPMSIEQFTALDKPWFAGGGKVVNDAGQRASIGVMLAEAREDLASSPVNPVVAPALQPPHMSLAARLEARAAKGSNPLDTYFSELERGLFQLAA